MTSELVVNIDESELKDAHELVKQVNGTFIESRTRDGKSVKAGGIKPEFDPITAILIGGGALALGRFVIGWMDRLRGGVIIDQRAGAEAEIRRSKDLPFGWVAILP